MNDGDGDTKFCEAEEERLACLRKKDVAGVRLAEIKILANLMTAQYGNAVINEAEGTVTVHVSTLCTLDSYLRRLGSAR